MLVEVDQVQMTRGSVGSLKWRRNEMDYGDDRYR